METLAVQLQPQGILVYRYLAPVFSKPDSAMALEDGVPCVATELNVKVIHYANEDQFNLLLSSMSINLLKTLLISAKVCVPLL